jgi:hypothetical protein
MKIPREFTINYIVHAISILDLDLLTQILRPLADSVAEKIEVEQYIHDFERIFKELDFEDSHFIVVHGFCTTGVCNKYSYTFKANYSQSNFTLHFYENINCMIEINECKDQTNENQIRFSSFKGDYREVPF